MALKTGRAKLPISTADLKIPIFVLAMKVRSELCHFAQLAVTVSHSFYPMRGLVLIEAIESQYACRHR